jgi:hypothetical protein
MKTTIREIMKRRPGETNRKTSLLTQKKKIASKKNDRFDSLSIDALNKLNVYRYICDVPYDVILDAEYNAYCKAAARICHKLGRLDHKPGNPGMPEDDYKKAFHGTSHSNLHMGRGTQGSVDGYMDDSDKNNISRVGHRRWCINPAMAKTGFGQHDKFSAMYSFDRGRTDIPDYDYVAFPAPGYMPVSFFKTHYAWNISLNVKKYQKPDKGSTKVHVYPLGSSLSFDPEKQKTSLKLNYLNVNNDGMGIPSCIIFRPSGIDVRNGKKYWVKVTGIKTKDGKDAVIEYLVEFASI